MKYRFLRKSEFVRKGDEFLEDGEWKKSVNWDLPKPIQTKIYKYRRPIKSTSRTPTNSRLRKCPHCGKSLRRALPKAANVVP